MADLAPRWQNIPIRNDQDLINLGRANLRQLRADLRRKENRLRSSYKQVRQKIERMENARKENQRLCESLRKREHKL